MTAPRIDPALLDACVHCGLCLEACPTYVETGLETESPRGRLVLMAGAERGRWPLEEARPHLDACLGCRSCESACPAGVAYGRILEETRAGSARPRSRRERWLVREVLWRGDRLGFAARVYRALRIRSAARLLSRIPVLPRGARQLLALAPRVEERPSTPPPAPGDGPAAYVLRGCVARALFPGSERALATLLAAGGYRVVLLDRPSCCGALAAHAGDGATALRFAGEAAALPVDEAAILVPTAAGCGAHLRELERFFAPGGRVGDARALAGRVRDPSEALLAAPRPLRFRDAPPVRVAYQDACHLRHGQGVVEAPRELLRRAGADVVELPEPDLCCGSAGTYNLARPAMAERLGRRKAAAIAASGAEVAVTANPGCAIQLDAYLPPGAPPVRTLVRFLAGRLAPAGSAPASLRR